MRTSKHKNTLSKIKLVINLLMIDGAIICYTVSGAIFLFYNSIIFCYSTGRFVSMHIYITLELKKKKLNHMHAM